jgi:cytoskeletal protein RodZ
MKTYEEMTESILQKTEKRRAKLARRKRLLSLFAAVAAVVIVMTAIPVGALIIANRANQPAEIPDAELTVSTAQTESFTAENSDNTKTEYSVSIRNVTSSAVKESGVLHGSREVDIAFWTHSGGVEYGDGGKWHRITASVYNNYSPDADRYQADIVVTDGSKELYHITDNGTADVT